MASRTRTHRTNGKRAGAAGSGGPKSVQPTALRPSDLLFLPVGAALTVRDRGVELFNELVTKGRKVEPRVRENLGKVRERIDAFEWTNPDTLRKRWGASTKRVREFYDDLNLDQALKELKVRERVDKVRLRLRELIG